MSIPRMMAKSERGMALLVSLVFLLLLTLIGISSMQNATLQEKMAGSVTLRNQSFQAAEAALRIGESAVRLDTYSLPVCSGTQCRPPAESSVVIAAGHNSSSGVSWIAAGSGFYGVQNIGTTEGAVGLSGTTESAVGLSGTTESAVGLSGTTEGAVGLSGITVTLYRVTAVGLAGNSRSVLESIYAK